MRKLISLLVLLCLTTTVLQAAFLKKVPCTLKQPDGTELKCFVTGDEFYSYLHDEQGYTIVQNIETGYYVYAAKDGEQLVPTIYVPNVDDPVKLGLKPYVNISAQQWKEKRDRFLNMVPKNLRNTGVDTIRNRGQFNNIVIFIRFSGDSEMTTPYPTVKAMFNDTTPGANSMVNYFRSASYNQLNVTTYLYPAPSGMSIVSYQDIYPRSYYQPYSSSNPNGYQTYSDRVYREQLLLKSAVDAVAPSIPTTLNVDKDNDGYVDNVCFVVKGNVDGWSDLLWPHKWNLFAADAYINGKQVNVYNFQLETAPTYFTNGTLCHEMFHTLGAPDLYHYIDGQDWFSSTGPWDLMENTSNPPQHSAAYMKYKYGNWIDSIPTLTQSGTYTLHSLGSASNEKVCYKIPSQLNNQYFVLEYRKKTNSFESGIPGSGILVYRIDTRFDGNADYNGTSVLDEVYIFRPGGSPTSAGNIRQAHLSSSVGRSEFNSYTNPYPFLSNGVGAYIDISDISDNNSDSITFVFNMVTCPPPANIVTYNIVPTAFTVGWMGLVPAQGYQVEYGLHGFEQGTGSVVYVSTNNCTVSGLQPSTQYDVYIRPVCSDTDTGRWSEVTTVTTACHAVTLPYTENFDSETSLPSCWGQEYVQGSNSWTVKTGGFNNMPASAHSGTKNLAFTHVERGNVTKAVTPFLNLNVVTNPNLTFWHAQKDYSGDIDELRVYYRTSPSASWNLLASYTGSIESWRFDSIALPNPSATYQIAFEATDNYGYGVVIDDIVVKGTPIVRQVSATVNNNEWGSVSGTGAYNMGQMATLTAVPTGDCRFVCWGDYNTNATISFEVNVDTTVNAIFTTATQDMYILRVESADPYMGAVSGTGVYPENTDITIQALPVEGYHFQTWSDGNTDNPRTLSLSADLTLVASFAPDTFFIEVLSGDDEKGTVSGGGYYTYNTEVVLTATPLENCQFISWADGNTDNPRTIVVTSDASYIADFGFSYYSVTVTSNNANMGTVYGSDEYMYNTVATISAYPNVGYEFERWSDDNVENPRNIIVTQDTTFVGYFKKKNSIDEVDFDYSISVYPNPASEAIVINADEVLKVEILDMQGRSVMVRENTKEIDVSRIEDGVYTLRIVTPQGDAIRKIVKLSSK